MHIVVIGLGEVGRHLLEVLDREGHDVVAVDASVERVAHAEEHHDVATIVGYGASEEVLEQAGVARSDLVVAVTDHDEVNLIAALAAQKLGAARVIARAQGTEWARWTEGVRYGLLGVDVVINPQVLVAQELAKIARSHGASEVVDMAQARIELVQIEITEQSRHIEKPLSQLTLPRDALVAAVVRNDELFVPGGADVLMAGDRAYLIGRPKAVLDAEDLFTTRREAKRVCIVGGGVMGESLARSLLRDGADVLIIEKDRDRAEELASNLSGVTVVHGEGTDQRLLLEEDAASYDLFAVMTGQDEVNLMAALIAKRVKVQRTACVVQRADYLDIYRQLGIDIVLSPRSVASDHILRYSRTTEVQSLTVLEGGQAEVVELWVRHGCRAIGVPVHRMNLPRGTLMAAIVRKQKVIVPRGNDEVVAGDSVILLTTSSARPTVERLFKPRVM